MLSYKTYKLINENFGGPISLGIAPNRSLGLTGSKLSEMGVHPDEIEDELDDEMGPEVDVDGKMDGEEEMGDDMGGEEMMGDEMDDENAPFPPDQMDDMASLAGLGGDEGDMDADAMGDEDMGDEMGDELHGDMDADDVGDPLDGDEDDALMKKKFPMESKKHMCGDCSDDEEHQEEDDRMKYMVKDDDDDDDDDKEKCSKNMKKESSFWDSFMKNAAGKVRAYEFKEDAFKEDAVLPPSNPNVGLGDASAAPQPGSVGYAPQQRFGAGSDGGEVQNGFFGYSQVDGIPSFHDYVEWKNQSQNEE